MNFLRLKCSNFMSFHFQIPVMGVKVHYLGQRSRSAKKPDFDTKAKPQRSPRGISDGPVQSAGRPGLIPTKRRQGAVRGPISFFPLFLFPFFFFSRGRAVDGASGWSKIENFRPEFAQGFSTFIYQKIDLEMRCYFAGCWPIIPFLSRRKRKYLQIRILD